MTRNRLSILRRTRIRRGDILHDLQADLLTRQALSEYQLREVMVDFGFNHFNVSGQKGHVHFVLGDYLLSELVDELLRGASPESEASLREQLDRIGIPERRRVVALALALSSPEPQRQ